MDPIQLGEDVDPGTSCCFDIFFISWFGVSSDDLAHCILEVVWYDVALHMPPQPWGQGRHYIQDVYVSAVMSPWFPFDTFKTQVSRSLPSSYRLCGSTIGENGWDIHISNNVIVQACSCHVPMATKASALWPSYASMESAMMSRDVEETHLGVPITIRPLHCGSKLQVMLPCRFDILLLLVSWIMQWMLWCIFRPSQITPTIDVQSPYLSYQSYDL